jgi:hypothetical protein
MGFCCYPPHLTLSKMRLIIFLFFTSALHAQLWTWDTLVSNQAGTRLVADKLQNWYSFERDSCILNRFDHSGALLLTKTFPGLEIKNVITFPDLGFCVAGNFSMTATIDSFTFTNTQPGLSYAVARFDALGTLVWAKSGGGGWIEDVCRSGQKLVIAGTAVDTIQFGSTTIPKSNTQELFLLMLDQNGDVVDHVIAVADSAPGLPYGWAFSAAREVELGANGDIYVTAAISGKVSIDTTCIRSISGNWPTNEFFLLKVDSTGALAWSKYLQQIPYAIDWYHELRTNTAGDAFLIVDHGSQYGYSQSDIFKTTANGQVVPFSFSLGMNEGVHDWNRWFRDLQLDSCDNLYITGYVNGWYPFDTIGDAKYYLLNVQVSQSAQVLWMQRDSSYAPKAGNSLAVFSPNRIVVAGFFGDSLTLKSSMYGNHPINWYGYHGNGGFFYAQLQTLVGTPVNVCPPGAQLACENAFAMLTATSTGAISWYTTSTAIQPLSSGPTFTVASLAAGVYTYYAEASTCSITTSRLPVTLTVSSAPIITAPDGIICKVGSYSITPTGAISYTFEGGSSVVSPTASSTYSFIGASAQGCTASAVCNVSVLPLPQASIVSSANFICPAQTVTLSALGATSYTWEGGTVSQTFAVSPTVTTIYTLAASDQYGCVNSAMFPQFVYDCTLGVNSVEGEVRVSFYPNPTTGRVYFDNPSATKVQIINVNGQAVYSRELGKGPSILELEDLPPGIYLIQIAGSRSRLVKQ